MSEVIDWDEAMQQCGDDEEFLRELLDDLRSETDAQMLKIGETIRVSCEMCQRTRPVQYPKITTQKLSGDAQEFLFYQMGHSSSP
jgi:hypothetical protein